MTGQILSNASALSRGNQRKVTSTIKNINPTSEDKTLLVGRNTLLILDLGLDVVDRVRGLHFERDRLSGQGLDEDLHAAAQTKHQVERRLLLDVVVGQRTAILQLLAYK